MIRVLLEVIHRGNEAPQKETEMVKVTFAPKAKGYEDKRIVETYDLTPQSNGFTPCYKTRAMALNWRIISVEETK